MKRLIFVLTLCLGMSVGILPVGAQMYVFENPLVGEKAPDFTLKSVSGKTVKYSELAQGKNSIIFFWTTWCPHCRQAIKEFNVHNDFAQRNVEMILIDVGEDAKKVGGYIQRNKIQFDVLLDLNSRVSEEYAVVGFPTFIFVNKEGKIVDIQHELPEDYYEAFE